MKRINVFFFVLLTTLKGISQNLVPNPSFEVYTQCPNSGGQINYASPWYSPNTASPDYFNACGTPGLETPLNVWGYQSPLTGIAYAEIAVFGSSPTSIREYIQVELNYTLTAGKDYCVSFFVSQTGISSFVTFAPIAVSEIGLLFTNSAVTNSSPGLLPYTPQIVSPTGVLLTDTVQWMEISGIYTALGGEQFITIGNFKDDAFTDTVGIYHNGQDPQGYYYVDDVQVIDCDSLVTIPESPDPGAFQFFPNPSNGEVHLRFNVDPGQEAALEIYDIRGKLIANHIISTSENEKVIHIEAPGLYLFRLLVNGKVLKNERLVVAD